MNFSLGDRGNAHVWSGDLAKRPAWPSQKVADQWQTRGDKCPTRFVLEEKERGRNRDFWRCSQRASLLAGDNEQGGKKICEFQGARQSLKRRDWRRTSFIMHEF